MNQSDYMDMLPTILYVLGMPLQFLRAYRGVSDWWIGILSVVFASAGYLLCANFVDEPVRLEVIRYLSWIAGGAGAVAGGTFTAAKAAKSVPGLPQTDSK